MNSINVPIAEIRRVARMTNHAADEEAAINLSWAIEPVADALPGARSAAAANALADTWRAQIHRWASDTIRYAALLSLTADIYAQADRDIEEELRRFLVP